MMTSLRRPLGVITLILGTFACSDGNNGQVTYPKPEGPAVGHWTRLADYPETAYATYSGKVIAGDEYVSWAGQGVFAECVNGVCPNGRVLNLVTNEWREMSLDGAPSNKNKPGCDLDRYRGALLGRFVRLSCRNVPYRRRSLQPNNGHLANDVV